MINIDSVDFQREKLINAGRMNLFHWLIVVLSVVLTFSAWHYSEFQLHQKLENKFQRHAEQVVSLVKERMKLYENGLWGGVAFIDAVGSNINYKQWLAYANSLHIESTYPGINGIGVIYNVKPNKLDQYLENQRTIRPDYAIHPSHNESEYWPITYTCLLYTSPSPRD